MTPTPIQRNAALVAGAAAVALLLLGAFFGPAADGSGARATRRLRTSTSTTGSRVTATSRPAATTTTSGPVPQPVPRLPSPPSPSSPPPAPSPPTPAPGVGSTEGLGVDPPPTRPPPDGLTAESVPAACTWDPADGGTLRASGTITNTANPDDTWLVSVDWDDDVGFLDNESDYFVAAPGRSTPWSLTVTGADAPTGALTCAVEVV